MPKPDNPLIHRIPIRDRDGRVVAEKEVVAYRGLLDMVHRDGLKEIRTRLLQIPSKENGQTAIVHATILTQKGRFTGIGDANPGNVNAKIAPHVIRMAETRAEARAMRKAVNIGVVALEELGEDLADDATYEGTVQSAGSSTTRSSASEESRPTTGSGGPTQAHPVATTAPPADRPPASTSAPLLASEQQRRFLYRLLAERRIEGDSVREYLSRELGTAAVKDATRSAVSALIDKLQSNGHSRSAQPAMAGR